MSAFDPNGHEQLRIAAVQTDTKPLALASTALPFPFKRLNHLNHVRHFPKPIRDASGHCRADFQRLVQPHEIVIHRVKGDRRGVVPDTKVGVFTQALYGRGEEGRSSA
jgi:hypothetical protein